MPGLSYCFMSRRAFRSDCSSNRNSAEVICLKTALLSSIKCSVPTKAVSTTFGKAFASMLHAVGLKCEKSFLR